jgi:hypothetical protein
MTLLNDDDYEEIEKLLLIRKEDYFRTNGKAPSVKWTNMALLRLTIMFKKRKENR